jgi:hypothetical protein
MALQQSIKFTVFTSYAEAQNQRKRSWNSSKREMSERSRKIMCNHGTFDIEVKEFNLHPIGYNCLIASEGLNTKKAWSPIFLHVRQQ